MTTNGILFFIFYKNVWPSYVEIPDFSKEIREDR